MCCTPEAELSSHAHELPVILPPRRSHTLPSNPGRYGVDPAPTSEHDGEPLTRAEAFKFWVPVWVAVTVLGVLVGFAIGFAKAWIQS